MLTELRRENKVVGVKQARRALEGGLAAQVFLAQDADARITGPIEALCLQQEVPVVRVPHMKALGEACGIAVGAAVAAVLK